MTRMKKNKDRLVNIGISKNTHLELLELQSYIYKAGGKKLKFDTLIAKLIEFYEAKYGI